MDGYIHVYIYEHTERYIQYLLAMPSRAVVEYEQPPRSFVFLGCQRPGVFISFASAECGEGVFD